MYALKAIKSIKTIMTITDNAVNAAIMANATFMVITPNLFITVTIAITTNKKNV